MSQSKLPLALKKYSVLPDNQSSLERAMEISLSAQVYGIDNPYPALLNAWSTPSVVVPYLAAEWQLPVWDAADPEHVKRNLAGNALNVRKLSGTRAGINLAMESFDYHCEFFPWHKQNPIGQPYSLEVIAWKKANKPVEPDKVNRLLDYIDEVKSERDNINVTFAFGVEAGIALSSAPERGITIFDDSYEGSIAGSPTVAAKLHTAGSCYQAAVTEDSASGALPNMTDCGGAVFTGGAYRMYLFTDFTPGAIT
ncbi:phage tail protein I [Pseudoalteromonas sp. Of7M-16]|uniref:phage tail protein I n=1 Tax=Pseudoalteromonas sp. Of7M-16 TaxID=2917756 RepID=UPI001EF4063F|nr:phage tail protein I [Pseudoalteromonas sp. Of7M-16]MCG7551573.1 phage tail protein I [Pseudoalteromonas sp. Of7M-16]